MSTSTHEHGGTLDLLITPDNFSLTDITVHLPSVSDHFLLPFVFLLVLSLLAIFLLCLGLGMTLTLKFFANAFVLLPYASPDSLSSLSPDQLALLYDDTISSIIEDLIPARFFVRRRAVVSPWFDSDCRSHRRRVRIRLSVGSVDQMNFVNYLVSMSKRKQPIGRPRLLLTAVHVVDTGELLTIYLVVILELALQMSLLLFSLNSSSLTKSNW